MPCARAVVATETPGCEDARAHRQPGARNRAQERRARVQTAKLDKITFELARLKAWKHGAKTEAMREVVLANLNTALSGPAAPMGEDRAQASRSKDHEQKTTPEPAPKTPAARSLLFELVAQSVTWFG